MKTAPLAFVGLLATFVACGSFDESGDTPVPPDRDGGTDSDASNDPCSAKILYVSGANGNDANDGCTKEKPIKTISAALALVSAKKLDLPEIRVCGGVYAEPGIRISKRVVLRGRYNCNTWTRGSDNGTRLENTAFPNERATLTIDGAELDRAVVIDGFEIAAPASGTGMSNAVLVNSASPLLTNLDILGGGTTNAPTEVAASVGLEARDEAKPEIASCTIKGGSGVGTDAIGSVAVLGRGTATTIDLHDSTIESGTGHGEYGGIGVRLSNGAAVRISKTKISFEGTATGTGHEAALGVWASNGTLEISESHLRGVQAECAAASCTSMAVAAENGANVTLNRNEIYAGDVKESATMTSGNTIGVFFGKDVVGVATNNVIHGGAIASDPDTQAFGVDLGGSTSAKFYGNTILTAGPKTRNRLGLRVNAPSGAGSGTGNNYVVGNVFVGGNNDTDIALGLATCGEAKFTEVRKNAFLNFRTLLLDLIGGGCQVGQTQAVLSLDITSSSAPPLGIQPYLTSLLAAADGNVMLRPSCSSDCIAGFSCANESECALKVFEAWDSPSGGFSTMDSPAGLRFSTVGPCAFNKGDPAFGGVLTQDFFGTLRTAPFSMGHHEQEACQ